MAARATSFRRAEAMGDEPFAIVTLDAEARRRAAEELKQRKGATTILTPEDVRGEYDAGRLLMTTLGGAPRVLTNDDLRQFAHQAKQLGKRFTGGITARQVIDMSLAEAAEVMDREPAAVAALTMRAMNRLRRLLTPTGR